MHPRAFIPFYLGDDLDAVTQSHDVDTSDRNDGQYHTEDDVGYQPTVQEAEFQAHDGHTSGRDYDDEAGPATTLDARFGAISTA